MNYLLMSSVVIFHLIAHAAFVIYVNVRNRLEKPRDGYIKVWFLPWDHSWKRQSERHFELVKRD